MFPSGICMVGDTLSTLSQRSALFLLVLSLLLCPLLGALVGPWGGAHLCCPVGSQEGCWHREAGRGTGCSCPWSALQVSVSQGQCSTRSKGNRTLGNWKGTFSVFAQNFALIHEMWMPSGRQTYTTGRCSALGQALLPRPGGGPGGVSAPSVEPTLGPSAAPWQRAGRIFELYLEV